MTQFTIEQNRDPSVHVMNRNRPVIYLNTFEGEGEQVLRILKRRRMPAVYACICQQS